jgi:DNA-binding XRE family transcriptional regulator
MHTRFFHIDGLPINRRSAPVANSIFDPRHQWLIGTLKEERKRIGVSQKELAARIGKSQSYISLIERNQRRLDVLEFILIGRALGMEIENVFSRLISVG